MRIFLAGIAALAAFGSVAYAQDRTGDANEDGILDAEEFQTRWSEEGERWGNLDEDKSGELSQEEFGTAAFDAYDEDDDGAWSGEERQEFEDDWL